MPTTLPQAESLSVAFVGDEVAATEQATAILMELMRHRRMSGPKGVAANCTCAACQAPHLPKIVAAVKAQAPITLVLPAFPVKSPNLAKVLGVLPDLAERRALQFLEGLAKRIGALHAPGAEIILASDGRIFSDVIGTRDEDVSAYRDGLKAMIADMGLQHVSTFNLEDLHEGQDFDAMRAQVMTEFGQDLEALRAMVQRGGQDGADAAEVEMHRLSLGMTRFLLEDASFPGQTKSRTQLQKEARAGAYQVIQRSQAWSGLVEKHFGTAVRLSIHPHGCGSAKLGIHLTEPAETDTWMTPWHGVALEQANGSFVLVKRAQAEALGARLVLDAKGQPSHFSLKA